MFLQTGEIKMKVAIYTGTFKKNQDGATKTLYELVNSLLKNSIDVGVWAFQITPQQREGLCLHKIPSLPLPLYPDYKISLPTPKIKRQIEAFDPDVIHITVPDIVGIFLIRYACAKGIPVLTSFHTDFPAYLKSYRLGIFYKWSWSYLRWFYNKSQVVLAPTDTIIDKLKLNQIKQVRLWSRGIERGRYNTSYRSSSLRARWGATDKRVILYAGRFVWYKDLETFIRVYEIFKKEGPHNVVFVLAGDGPIRSELECRMPDARFTGYLQGTKLSRVYASSDILLFPSTTETFGNVVLEALSSGLPAVVSDVGGCREIVEKSGGGIVAKAGDVTQFYQSCKQLVENRESHETCRLKGLDYVKKCSWTGINNSVIDEYRRLARKRTTQKKPVFLPLPAHHYLYDL
ncbi:MAG: glycosyltransferase family 1 protein [Candidatus Aminicenantes bacterium]|nr:glycosyltransferase family 1 protein [Candidatus Aminicenantes bacterium]